MSSVMAEAKALLLQMSRLLSKSGPENEDDSTCRMSSATVGSKYWKLSPKAVANSCSTSSTVL